MVNSVTVKPFKPTGKEEVLIAPMHSGARGLGDIGKALPGAARTLAGDYISRKAFTGKKGQTFLLTTGGPKSPVVLLLGLGAHGDGMAENVADAGGAAFKELSRHGFKSAALLLPADDAAGIAHAFTKGFMLAGYSFSLNQTPPKPSSLKRLVVLCDTDRTQVGDAVKRARIVAEHNTILRDLVNAPANTMTPTDLAKRATALCREHKVRTKVLGKKEIEKLGMGAVLAVSRGSVEEPKFIIMQYNAGKTSLPHVCLVGKGVTFDSGGISLKPWDRMNEMKGDMAGGGLVISTIAAAARMKLPLRIDAVVPAVENMPDGTALKPGDVVHTYAGKTIEILSTDAEGRLILSDALTYAREEFDPDVMIDFATLTGAVLIALGTRIAGIMGNSQEHMDGLIAAGKAAGEPVWQLPLDEHFYEGVAGDITDYKNYSGRNGSSITAAALLGKFADKTPWVHVDIAGTFWSNGGKPSYHSKGATGYGVDLALRFLESLAGA